MPDSRDRGPGADRGRSPWYRGQTRQVERRQRRVLAGIELHRQEGRVQRHVRAPEPPVELDRVDDDRPGGEAVGEVDVLQAQVTVSVADLAIGQALAEQRGSRCQGSLLPVVQAGQGRRCDEAAGKRAATGRSFPPGGLKARPVNPDRARRERSRRTWPAARSGARGAAPSDARLEVHALAAIQGVERPLQPLFLLSREGGNGVHRRDDVALLGVRPQLLWTLLPSEFRTTVMST